MIPATLGCPHDYALTPEDMRQIASAQVLIVNGLGLEEFLGAPVRRANPGIALIDASALVDAPLPLAEAGAKGFNPHIFASPAMSAKMAAAIARGLSKIDPEGADTYEANSSAYGLRMAGLSRELAALGSRLQNNRVITQHGVFDYLAREAGLKIVGVLEEHGGVPPSAAQMRRLVALAISRKVGAVITEPQYPDEVGRTIAREAAIPLIRLDPVANGPKDSPCDYFDGVMRENIELMGKTLGLK